jgi:hypothetical protein
LSAPAKRRGGELYAGRRRCRPDEEAVVAVDKFRTANGLSYQGNPAGLVDARFVETLRVEYIRKVKG